MIAGRGHGRGQAPKDGSAVVLHRAGLAVHEVRRADDVAAEGVADGLMTQTDAKHRNLAGEVADQFDADARFVRRAGTRRDHDRLRTHRSRLRSTVT